MIFKLVSGTQQLQPEKWLQGFNPDRYTGNDYVSSSALAIVPQADGGAAITAPAPGRYKIVAVSAGVTYQTYLLVLPYSPITQLRGLQLFTEGAVDRTYASAVLSVLKLTNSNAAYLQAIGCMDIDSGSWTVSEITWTPGSWCPGTPLADIGWLIDTLHSQGYSVFVGLGVTAMYEGVSGELEAALPSLSLEQVQSAFQGYGGWCLQVAQLAQQHGAEYLLLGSNWQIYNAAVTAPVNAQWAALLPQIRSAYSGKVYYGEIYPCAPSFDFQDWSLVDGIHYVPGYNASYASCGYPPTIGIYNIHAEEMLPYLKYFEAQAGSQLASQVGLPQAWHDLYAANVDGMNSLAASVFTTQVGVFDGTTVPSSPVMDNQEDVDLFEATMRTGVPDSRATAFFLWDANVIAPSQHGAPSASGVQSDAMMQPALLGALTNWFGGDATQFAPCWADVPEGQLYQEDFETTACPVSTLYALAQQTYPVGSSAAVITDPENSSNRILRITNGYSILGTWADYIISVKVRFSGSAQASGGISLRAGDSSGYNAYTVYVAASGVSLWKSIQGQNNQLQAISTSLASGQWHSVTITAAGPQITAIVDGAPAINFTDETSPLLTGQVVLGACCDANSIADYDNVTVSTIPDNSALRITAIVNAASNLAGPIAPGEIVLVYGTDFGPDSVLQAQPQNGNFPTSLAGATVLFGGTPAPLIYASSGVVAAIVPYEVAGMGSTNVQIQWSGSSTKPFTVAVKDAQPGLFSVDSSGTGMGAVLNTDYSLNTPANPVDRSGIAILYETGEGQTNPPGSDGSIATGTLPKPVQPVTVLIGGVQATVLYAGAAPGEVAGLMQINVQIPSNAPVGNQVPVLVVVGDYISQSGLTIAIQ